MEKDFNLSLYVLVIYLGVAVTAILSTIAVIPLFVWSIFQPESGEDVIQNIVDSF